MPLDFVKTGADTGYNDSDSVQPVANAEAADQTVFRRPSENIRNRTEVIRQAVDEALAEMSSDRGLTLVSDAADATIAWGGAMPGGTGVFTLVGGTDLRAIPILNPSAGNAKNDIWGRRRYTFSGTKYFTMRSKLRISEGGNNIKTEIFSVNGEVFGGGQAVNVTIEGSKDGGGNYNPLNGPVKVRIQLSKTGGAVQSRWSDVLAGITGNAYSNAWLSAGVTAGEESTIAVECTSGYFWESGGAGWDSVSGCDAQGYRITASELSTFFSTNKLYEGDSLFIKFPTAKARLDQAGDVTIGATLLKILHRSEGTEPVSPVSTSDGPNLMHCVPLCHVDNDNLIFINGTVIPNGGTGTIAPDTTLRVELADDGDGTGGVACGSKIVYGDVQPGTKTPKNYAQGTLFAQLGEMLDWTNDHYKGLDATTKHNYEDLLNKPVYYISPTSGEGDFTSLNSALNDATIRANGGVIIIKAGSTLSENITLGANLTKKVLVIGQSVTVQPSSATAIFNTGATYHANVLEFCGIDFVQSYASQYGFNIANTGATDGGTRYIFRNCSFSKTSTGIYEMVLTQSNVELIDCYFTQSDYTQNAYAVAFNPQTGASINSLRIVGCTFYSCAGVVRRYSGTGQWGELVVENCYMSSCGYSASSASIGTLIYETDTDGTRHVSIRGNRMEGSTGATNSAAFCYVRGNGEISSNQIMQGIGQTPSSAVYMILASNSSTSGEEGVMMVENNTLKTGEGGGISAGLNTRVVGNQINAFTGSTNCPYAFYTASNYSYFEGNDVALTGTSVNCVAFNIASGGLYSRVSSNRIDMTTVTGMAHTGIKCATTYATISGNKIWGNVSDSLVGVTLTSNYCIVADNQISGVITGVGASATSYTTVTGNYIQMRDPGTTGYGVYVGDHCTVANNVIVFNTNTVVGSYGVYLSTTGHYTTIVGNTISGTGTGIYLNTTTYCTVSGNVISTNSYTSGLKGISAVGATKFSITGNQITVADVTNAVGIDCARGSLTELQSVISSNSIFVLGTTNPTGRKGIDCTYCNSLAVVGNSLWPYLSIAPNQYILITNATGVGLGQNLSTPNVDTYNNWVEPI